MEATKWALDPMHSEITFKVKHMMIANVTGSFTKFDVKALSEGNDFTKGNVIFTADVDSVDTHNEQRDGHLRSPEFFDGAQFPQIKFESTSISKKGEDSLSVQGNLTMKGVTKPIILDLEFGGTGKDPYGNTKAGFTINGKINRKDFGLNWNAALETGGVLVGDEIKVHGEIQLVKEEKVPA